MFADPVFGAQDPRIGSISKNGPVDNPALEQAGDVKRSAEESGLNGFPRLRFSRQEADQIMRLVPRNNSLEALDFAANKSVATSADLKQYRIVHFATHGLINSRHADLSGIVLSLVDQEGKPQNGFLRLYDIYNMNLSAELVVLSACQTALGKDIKGEGSGRADSRFHVRRGVTNRGELMADRGPCHCCPDEPILCASVGR